jgi:hypothetical protein
MWLVLYWHNVANVANSFVLQKGLKISLEQSEARMRGKLNVSEM